MANNTFPKSAPMHFRRILLLPLGLALLLVAIDWGFHGTLHDWLQRRMEAADGWLLSVFTADIHRNGGSNQAIPPKTVTPVTDADVWEVRVEQIRPEDFVEAMNAFQQSVAANSTSTPADDETSGTAESAAANQLLRTAVARAGAATGNQQICRVVLTGIALTGQRQADGSWQLQPGILQRNLVIPDEDGALHPAGLLNTPQSHQQNTSGWFHGIVRIESQAEGITIVWTDESSDPVMVKRIQAELITGTLQDVSNALSAELKPDRASAQFLQDLLADSLRSLIAEQLGDGLEADEMEAELTTPGQTRITIDGDSFAWSFVSSATVRLQQATKPQLQSATLLTE